MADDIIKFRVDPYLRMRLDAAARMAGTNISDICRKLLNTALDGQSDLQDLRQLILNLHSEEPGHQHLAIFVETLLLIRASVDPGKVKDTHAAMSKLGIMPWADKI